MTARDRQIKNRKNIACGSDILGLLAASAYTWQLTEEGGDLVWKDDDLAASLLCSRAEDIPRTEAGYIERLCGDASGARKQAIAALSWNGAKYQLDYKLRTFDGRNIWVEERGLRLEGDGKTATKIVGVVTNIQTRKIQEEQAGYHASFDSLTGLWNSNRMAEGLNLMLANAQRYDRQASYVVLSVTNIKDINATYGYEAGDRLTKAIADRLKTSVRTPDICGRVSGRNFGIGLSDCGPVEMQNVAERIIKTVSSEPYSSPHGDLRAKFAVGGSVLSQKATSAADAMQQAYTAIAHSRLKGGEFVAYNRDLPDLKPRQSKSELTRDDIISALNDRRITLAYQPIVHAESRDTHHFECLLRLRRDDGELASAAEFIMAAERLECVHLLDRRALEIARDTLIDLPNIKIALNVSAATVKNSETAKDYIGALKTLGSSCKRVNVEMTETVALDDPAMAGQFSMEVRALGCHFSIDDFGAGHTTFRNLMAIEADEIKIDGSFIRDLSLTPHKQVFVRMMVDLAQTFSVKTVAEMVGSREDADLLTRLGVDYLQGYMFGIPAPSPQVSLNGKPKDISGFAKRA
ncbi:MAG: EAL domain-containing protein [Robiginitomaculum sp.]|nr:EAL domain-containing protein [Robiginitomaculum sp.]